MALSRQTYASSLSSSFSFRHLSFPNILDYRAWDIRFRLTGPLIVQTHASSPSIIANGVRVSNPLSTSLYIFPWTIYSSILIALHSHTVIFMSRVLLLTLKPRRVVSSRLYGTDLIYELNETFSHASCFSYSSP
jgi:hypothetical protein